MGMIAGCGRIVMISVNIASAVVALVLIGSGCAIKYFLGEILKSDLADMIGKVAFSLFVSNTPVPNSIDFGAFTDAVGVILIVVGAVLLIVSIFGCCTACCSLRPMLIIFGIFIGALILAQIVAYAVILPRDSEIHVSAKKSLEKDIETEYNRHDINSFTISADILFLAAECCGVNGPDDFDNNPHLEFNFSRTVNKPEIPPSCCRREYITALNWNCAKNKSMGYSEGCYGKLQDIVEDWYPWLIPVILIMFAIQIGEIIAAVMIYYDNKNEII